jgi:2-oxo-4-hydroxy-4-carboxy--5-ureidoimidazoline (OHCU) decarboxylase
MVSRLRARMTNAPADEIAIAAAEQAKITELRLHKLLAELAEG